MFIVSFLLPRLEVIDKCFSHDTVEEIVDALVSYDLATFTILTLSIVRLI
jgi:hypothetical protein